LRVSRSVLFGVTGDFGGSLGVVVIKEKRLAIGHGSEDARIGTQNFAIEFMELKIASNVGTNRANGVRKSGGAETGMKFLGDGAATAHFTAFKNERLETAFCEIERG